MLKRKPTRIELKTEDAKELEEAQRAMAMKEGSKTERQVGFQQESTQKAQEQHMENTRKYLTPQRICTIFCRYRQSSVAAKHY